MTEAEQVMKRCQIGTRNYNEANNLHADCYRVIGKLLAEHAMQEVQRLGQEIEQCQCTECQIKPHASDCAVHSEPAYPKGKCDCGAQPEQEPKIGCVNHDCDQCKAQPERLAELGWQEIDCPICGGGARAFPKPEQEPVAYYLPHKGFYWAKPTSISAPTIADVEPLPLYATPPQRTWVGLTEQDLDYLCNLAYTGDEEFALAVQAKLMEKNA